MPAAGPASSNQSGGIDPELRAVEFPREIIDLHTGTFSTVLGHDLLSQTFLATIGGTEVALTRRERESETDPFVLYTDEYSADYHITGFAAREGGDEAFLAGVTQDGVLQIERWRYILPDGHQAVRYPTNQPPAIGIPQPEYTPSVAPLGGVFIEFNQLPQPRRRAVYSTDTTVYTALAADPEGRFLLAYDYTHKKIVRFPLASLPSSPEVLFDTTAYPQLAQVSSISIRDYPGEGRKALLRRNFGHEPTSLEIYGALPAFVWVTGAAGHAGRPPATPERSGPAGPGAPSPSASVASSPDRADAYGDGAQGPAPGAPELEAEGVAR